MIRVVSALAGVLCATIAHAQPSLPAPPSQKTETTMMALDLLANLRSVLSNAPAEKRSDLAQLISIRLAKCSVIYRLLTKTREIQTETRDLLNQTSEAYMEASMVLTPDAPSDFKLKVEKSVADTESLRLDREKLSTLMNNCKGFGERQGDAEKSAKALLLE